MNRRESLDGSTRVVRSNGNVVGVGKSRDAPALGDPGGVHKVRLDYSATLLLEQLAELPARQQPLACRNRNWQVSLKLRHNARVLERDRLLEPVRAEW